MCGIVAYVGPRSEVKEILIKGLGRLEYRGYDSAGVVILAQTGNEDAELELTRSLGKVANLAEKLGKIRIHVNMNVERQAKKRVRISGSEDVKKQESVFVIINKDDTVADLIEGALSAFANEKDVFVHKEDVTLTRPNSNEAISPATVLSTIVERDQQAFNLHGSEDPAGKSELKSDGVYVGMGHTRWATHGEPAERNSHPHVSNDGQIAVVHNGIIENQTELRAGLLQLGYKFTSDTDTEIIPVLIQHYLKKSQTFQEALFKAISKLRGAFGLCIMHKGEATIYGVRLGSPVCLGIGSNGKENFLGSEPAAFVGLTEKIIHLEDFEVAVIKSDSWSVKKLTFVTDDEGTDGVTDYEDNEKKAHPSLSRAHAKTVANLGARIIDIPGDIIDHQKGSHPHFMLKEIYEQPDAISRTISGKTNKAALDRIDIHLPRCLQHVLFLACGTSYHAGQIAEYIIENNVGIPVRTRHASEYLSAKCLLTSNDLVIAISQSGETADTRQALTVAKEHGASIAGLVNVVGSQIARLAGQGLYLKAGPEIGVASTKAFSCQVAAGNLVAAFLSRDVRPDGFRDEIVSALSQVPDVLRGLIKSDEFMAQCKGVGEWVAKANHALYLGRGIDFPVALEGALKLKEISYIHAEGYPAGEMKHGPIALIDEDMPVFFIIGRYRDASGSTGGAIYEKTRSNMAEVKSRKGKIVVITDHHDDPSLAELATVVIRVPHINETVSPIIKVLPLQLIAYHAAVNKGLDPDKPRNLAKSVTVQ